MNKILRRIAYHLILAGLLVIVAGAILALARADDANATPEAFLGIYGLAILAICAGFCLLARIGAQPPDDG